jgi:hypothetical protein
MKTTTLTNEEFSKRGIDGEVFILNACRYFYDATHINPFRCNDFPLVNDWKYFDGKTIFEIEEPKPIMERRWKWRKDDIGYTNESGNYMADTFIGLHQYINNDWYKVEDLYIDVEVKQ